MIDALMSEKKKGISCAFHRFFARMNPVVVDARIYKPHLKLSFHNHDFPQLWICTEGKYLHRVEDRVEECTRGSVVLVPPGYCHTFCVQEGCAEVISVNLLYDIFLDKPAELYTNVIANMFLPPFSKELGYTIPIFRTLSEESLSVIRNHISWLSLLDFQIVTGEVNLQMYRTLEAMFSLPELALPDKYRDRAIKLTKTCLYPVTRALGWMNTYYPEKILEEDLVKVAGVGHTEFFRKFRLFTGYTYSIYLQRLRIQHVDTYLMHTEYPLSYISDICGFVSQAYMTQLYKKYVGLTPRLRRIEHKQWLVQHPDRKLHVTSF